jgi:hypothetical protein
MDTSTGTGTGTGGTGSGGGSSSSSGGSSSSSGGGSSSSSGSNAGGSGSSSSSSGGASSSSSSSSGGGSSSSGGRARDGGSEAGTGSSGGGGDGGPAAAGCANTSYKLCEDFETGTVGALPTGWTQYKGYGAASPMNVALATDQFHSGTMSLKSDDLGKSGAARAQRSLASLGATASKHWGRIFYKVQTPVSATFLHTTFVSLFGSAGEDRIVDTVKSAGGGMHQWLFNIPSDSCCTSSAYNWTYDANWHCAEWYVDATMNAFRFFSDSMEVTQLAFTGRTGAGMSNPFADVLVGSTTYQAPTAPWIMWFDDLAINDTQIGCK